ncbi:hypothetical protein PIB30_047844 [Stylosanthes scabra]|uniref:GRF-type domain-containing protein n=1 Tax=Stylosanthes scabra TaxID=79078 RepID=A0ABU6SHD1_9FABA|nr:hypothetical protein [Stylosanthes scabra]
MRLKPSFGSKLDLKGLSPIHIALKNNHHDVVHRLVEMNKGLIRLKGREGLSPLHFVCQCGQRNASMVVGTLIATAIYQTVLSPPGGVTQGGSDNGVGNATTSSLNSTTTAAAGKTSRSQGSWVKTPSRGRVTKVPQWCGCGLRPVLRWSGTEQNPDRPFYGCANYNTFGQRWCGLFVWADGEEDNSMVGRHQFEVKIDQGKMNLWFRVSKLED